MKIAIASLNPTINDWSGQVSLIRRIIDAAKYDQAELLVLPELAIGTPDAGDLYLRPQTAQYAEQCLSEIAPMTMGLTLVCGAPIMHEDKLYNVAAVFHDGLLIALVPKRYLEAHTDEDRYFARWDHKRPFEQHFGASFGAFHSEIPGFPKLEICLGDIACFNKLEPGTLCIELNSKPFAVNAFRENLAARRALSETKSLTIVRTNLLGCHDGTHIYDGGGYILENGQIVSLAPRFAFEDYILTTSDNQPPQCFDPTLALFTYAGSCPKSEDDYVFAELELAICLAINDYMSRAHISTLCLALSGGRDSAMIAVLVGRLIDLKYADETPEQRRARMKAILKCAYLPSRASSSSGTQKAALALAEHFGFDCPVIPIEALAASAVATIEASIGRQLTWETDDLALQNIQARTRSTVIWTLANATDALLLTTGNLSEAAVGYATMDGDSSGCLDPIGDIPKTLVSAWLEWARNFHNIPALDFVFAQPPSAELRPLENEQQDEKDLMPYPVLDAYIDWFVVRKYSPAKLFALAKTHLGKFYSNDDEIRRDIRRFVTLLSRAQWKRVRFANSFSVISYDLSPASGLRWPCLMNAFSKALDEL